MATTKRRSSTSKKGSASETRRSASSRASQVIRNRPIATAAVATGLVSGIAAAVAGFLAFRKSGKTFSEFSDDVTTGLKDRASTARDRVKDGIDDLTARAKEWSEPRRDGVDETRSQAEIAEEALTTKQIGKKTKRPVDPTIEEELKVGSASY